MAEDQEHEVLTTPDESVQGDPIECLLPWTADRYISLLTSAKLGSLDSPLRGIAWRLFLGLLPAECTPDEWVLMANASREHYQELRARYVPLKGGLQAGGPGLLGELVETIDCDLQRLYISGTDASFFMVEGRQSLMRSVLFVWSVSHQSLSYRQGMHELLALIVLVLERDADVLSARDKELSVDGHGHALSMLTAREHNEEDAFVMFERLMKHMEPFYAVCNELIGNVEKVQDTPLVVSCHRVQTVRLRSVEEQVSQMLDDLGIAPQVYCLRWLRLMFGREFTLEAVLVIWDWLLVSAAPPPSSQRDPNVGGTGRGNPIRESLELFATAVLVSLSETLMSVHEDAVLGVLINSQSAWSVPQLIACASALPPCERRSRKGGVVGAAAGKFVEGSSSLGGLGGVALGGVGKFLQKGRDRLRTRVARGNQEGEEPTLLTQSLSASV